MTGTDDAMVAAVAAVLEAALPPEGGAVGEADPGERLNFAFTVLLNALMGALEEIRAADPEGHDRFRALAIAVLGDD